MVADEYRLGNLHKPDLRRLLGFETSFQGTRTQRTRSARRLGKSF
jgi:hypothetical protein